MKTDLTHRNARTVNHALQRSGLVVFFWVLSLSSVTGIGGLTYYSCFEMGLAQSWASHYAAAPGFLLSLGACAYLRPVLMPRLEMDYTRIMFSYARLVLAVIVCAAVSTAVLLMGTAALIVFSNDWLGDGRSVQVDTPVLDAPKFASKGSTRLYVTIAHPLENRLATLRVPDAYRVSERFKRELKVGRWGLLYAR